MKATSIRELKHATTAVLAWVEHGEKVEVRRRGKTVAVLSPPVPVSRKRPNFAARLKSIYGNKVLAKTATKLLSEERGER